MKDRAPKCQTCHMRNGDHRVFSAWGFLAVRLPEDDAEWMGYRATILKGLGVLDPDGKPYAYPDLLTFYDVNTKIEEVLYEMFMDHRMKAFQANFHMNPDYATWYGYAKMVKDVVEIKELAQEMRAAHGAVHAPEKAAAPAAKPKK